MADSASSPVLASTADGILTLRLNRADKKNSLTQAMYTALTTALTAAATDPSVRVAVIAGAPDCFCAGNDLADFMQNPKATGDAPVIRFMNALAAFPKPVIAAVNGLAVGVGVTLLLHCDLIYAGDSARFTLPFVSLGIVPEYAATYLMPRIMGHARAMDMVMFGEPFTAAHALECGLLTKIVPADQLEAFAQERARKLAAQPPQALRTAKRLMKRWTDPTIAEAIPLEAFHFGPMLTEPEAQEAMSAFMQKRKPDFSKFS